LSSAEERIESLRYEYLSHPNRDSRVKIIDTLITFGDKGVDAIRELIRVTDNDELMLYGLEQIRRSRESP